MHTQKYRGRNQLIKRLSEQVKSKGKAIEILRDYGYVKKNSEELTKKGEKRNEMTARERAIDRVAKSSHKPKRLFKYDSKNNQAVLKKKS